MRVFAFIIVLVVLGATTLAQNCPPCYYDQNHLVARHGYDGDGRQKVNIYIDWSSMPNVTQTGIQNVTAAVEGGIAQWNNATNPAPQLPGITKFNMALKGRPSRLRRTS